MTDRKRGDDFADLTVPVPVRVQDSKPVTDEADAETFIGEVSRRPVTGDDDTVQRSFDDDVAKQKVPARPARTDKPKPAPNDVEFPGPSDTNQFMQAVFAGAGEAIAGKPARADRVSTKKIAKPVEVSSEDRAEPDEPTVAKSPDLLPDENTEAAPIANPDDADSVPTAPIPMMAGLTREMLRDDEPSLPRMRPPPEVVVNGVGDGIEREAPSAPATTPEPPVDHTPLYRPVATSTELVGRVEDEKDITSPNLEIPAKSRAPLFIIGAVAGLALAALVIAVAVALSRSSTSTTELKGGTAATVNASETKPSSTSTPSATETKASATPTPSAAETKASATPTPSAAETKASATTATPSATETKASATATPTPSVAETKESATATKESATATPAPSAAEAKESAPTTPRAAETKESEAPLPAGSVDAKESALPPKSSAPSAVVNVARRADGFGPFVDHTGRGLGGSLDAAARSIVGSLDGTEVGVRGEILHVDTSKKDKMTSVECAFTVFDKTGGRARMGATAKGAKASEAAQACAQSLAPDLKSAVARVRGP